MKISSIEIYLNDVIAAKDFWINKLGFLENGEIAISDEVKIFYVKNADQNVSLGLTPLSIMQGSEVNTGCPSLLFIVEDIAAFHEDLVNKKVKVTDVSEHPLIGKNFVFFDIEENAFAVKEQK